MSVYNFFLVAESYRGNQYLPSDNVTKDALIECMCESNMGIKLVTNYSAVIFVFDCFDCCWSPAT